MSDPAHRRRLAVQSAKLLLAVGIFAWLFYSLRGEHVFGRLVNEPKDWPKLALAQTLVLAALSINYMRWYVLVRPLGLDFRVSDAFRLGSLGLLLSQVSFGSVGGDLFKAVFIAREQPGKRTEAVASVVIDRVVGLYAMLLVASVGVFISRDITRGSTLLQALGTFVVAMAALGTVGVAALMVPAITGPRVRQWAHGVPLVGPTRARLLAAAAVYRDRRGILFAAIGMSCVTHTLLVLTIWLIGRGLPVEAPSLPTAFLTGPLSLCAGAIPLTPGGLGTFEGAMDKIYEAVGARPGDGLLVAIAYRLMTYVMAAIGAVYYLSARRTVAQVLDEAEELAEDDGQR